MPKPTTKDEPETDAKPFEKISTTVQLTRRSMNNLDATQEKTGLASRSKVVQKIVSYVYEHDLEEEVFGLKQ